MGVRTGLLALDPERELARLLPKDHRVRAATAQFQRNVAQLDLDLAEFREAWFADPPRLDEGRRSIQELLATARKVENALRELDSICRPVEP
jgi:hypothetical protein